MSSSPKVIISYTEDFVDDDDDYDEEEDKEEERPLLEVSYHS